MPDNDNDKEQETRFVETLKQTGRAAVKWGDRYASAEFNDDHEFYEINVYDQYCRFLGDHYIPYYKGADWSPQLTTPKDVLDFMRGPMGRVEHEGVPLECLAFDDLQTKLKEAGKRAGLDMEKPARESAARDAARNKEAFLAKCRADAREAAYSDRVADKAMDKLFPGKAKDNANDKKPAKRDKEKERGGMSR